MSKQQQRAKTSHSILRTPVLTGVFLPGMIVLLFLRAMGLTRQGVYYGPKHEDARSPVLVVFVRVRQTPTT